MPRKFPRLLDRGAQAPDVNVHGALVAGVVEAPHLLQQLGSRERHARVTRELAQQCELARREFHRDAVDASLARAVVDFQSAELQRRTRLGKRRRRSPEHRFHARDDLARRERLGHVVVRTKFEADDAIDFIRARREHDDRHRDLLAPNGSGNVEAVDPRQSDVENQQIGDLARAAQRRVTVGGADDLESLALQMMRKQIANGAVVFGDHDRSYGHAEASARAARAADPAVYYESSELRSMPASGPNLAACSRRMR